MTLLEDEDFDPAGTTPLPWLVVAGLLLAAAAVFNALLLNSSDGVIDDAYIFFRYVDNLFAGHGLTWNPGETGHDRVEGYTSFLYVMLLSIPRALGMDLAEACHVLNIGLFAALVLVVWQIARRAFDRPGLSILVAPALLATSASLGQASRSGLEVMLFGFTMMLACALHLHAGSRPFGRALSGAAFGLVVLTRPEGFLVYAICALLGLSETLRHGLRAALTGEARRLLGFLLIVGPHLLWRLWYYGEPLPNTYYAKVEYSWSNVYRGIEGLLAFLTTMRGTITVVSLVAWSIAPSARTGRLFASLVFGWLLYLTAFLGLPDWGQSYTFPIDWFSLSLLGWALAAIAHDRSIRPTLALVVPSLLLAVANMAPGISRLRASEDPWNLALIDPPGDTMIAGFIEIGKKLKEIAEPGDTVAVGACGAIPYFSELVTYDTLGLNDKHIARQPVKYPGQASFGHEKGDGAYIASKEPTYLIPLPLLTPEPHQGYVSFSVTFSEITAITEFRSRYQFRSVQVDDGRYFNYFELNRP